MELKVYQDTVTAAQTICDTKLELPVETELLIPDYLPPVFKIVKCFVVPVVLQKQLLAGRLTVEGYLRCVVYYQTDADASLCQTEQKLPFTKQVELKPGEYSAAVIATDGETEYVNCRAVNQRRVDVRGAFVLHIAATAQARSELITALAGAGMQQKTASLACTHTLGVQEKLMTAEEDITFAQPPAMILNTRCVGNVTETKLLGGKAVVKGELETEILYRTGPGCTLVHGTYRVPFHEIVDVDGADEACRAFVLIEPTGCTITAGPEEKPDASTLSVTALLQVQVYRSAEYLAVCDAFSTGDETLLQTVDIPLETVADDFTQPVEATVSGVLPDESAELVDALATVLPVEPMEQDGTTVLRGRVVVHLLCKNALGEVDCYDKACEYTLPRRYAQTLAQLHVHCKAAVTAVAARRAGGETTAVVQLTVRGLVSTFQTHTVLEQVQLIGPRQRENDDIALRIYFAEAGEELFDIAKRYAASPQAIATANDVPEGALEASCRLLIPASL